MRIYIVCIFGIVLSSIGGLWQVQLSTFALLIQCSLYDLSIKYSTMHINAHKTMAPKMIPSSVRCDIYGQSLHLFHATTFITSHIGSTQGIIILMVLCTNMGCSLCFLFLPWLGHIISLVFMNRGVWCMPWLDANLLAQLLKVQTLAHYIIAHMFIC